MLRTTSWVRLWEWLFSRGKPATDIATPSVGTGLDPALIERIKTLRQANAQRAMRDQVEDVYLDALQPLPPWTRYSVRISAATLLTFLLWAGFATLDEVTTGIGKVVPSSREQVVQTSEAGVVAELLVKEGDVVEADQALLRIDDARLGSQQQESQARTDALTASAARLRAELHSGAPTFPQELMTRRPDLIKTELETLATCRRALDSNLASVRQSIKLTQDELAITEPLAAKGLVSDVEVLRLRRTLTETRGRLDELHNKFKADASAELARIEAELGAQNATLSGRNDALHRAVLRAPKRGVVKNIRVTTLGGYIQAGQDILEIVPMDDVLLVETRIRPSDIAFLRTGLPAVVKITAYDSGSYGWLDGELVQISPDTLRDDVRREETYYKALVKTHSTGLRTPNGKVLPIIPGMQASVDIKTGQKSVLAYLFKPILRAREALRER